MLGLKRIEKKVYPIDNRQQFVCTRIGLTPYHSRGDTYVDVQDHRV